MRAFQDGSEFADLWKDAYTVADGLRVPVAIGDFLILRALRASRGTALTVTDHAMLEAAGIMGRLTGIFPAPEGAATLAALQLLVDQGWIQPDERVVLFNTGSGLKYAHLWAQTPRR